MTEDRSPDPARGNETIQRLAGEPRGDERLGADAKRGRETLADAGLEGAPEGATERARPDVDEERPDEERALREESAIDDPHPEQPDPESGAGADAP